MLSGLAGAGAVAGGAPGGDVARGGEACGGLAGEGGGGASILRHLSQNVTTGRKGMFAPASKS